MTAVAVCGFGRCGSSMVMRMLDAGGIPPVAGSSERAYELPTSEAFPTLTADVLEGHAVKLLDGVLHGLFPTAPVGWRIIWLDRDPTQQGRSHVKLMRFLGYDIPPRAAKQFARSYGRDRPRALDLLAQHGQVHTDTYENALRDPTGFTDRLADFLHPDFDLARGTAAQVIHRRRAYCAPGLTFETTGQPEHDGRGRTGAPRR